jgi:hypothetical protein
VLSSLLKVVLGSILRTYLFLNYIWGGIEMTALILPNEDIIEIDLSEEACRKNLEVRIWSEKQKLEVHERHLKAERKAILDIKRRIKALEKEMKK